METIQDSYQNIRILTLRLILNSLFKLLAPRVAINCTLIMQWKKVFPFINLKLCCLENSSVAPSCIIRRSKQKSLSPVPHHIYCSLQESRTGKDLLGPWVQAIIHQAIFQNMVRISGNNTHFRRLFQSLILLMIWNFLQITSLHLFMSSFYPLANTVLWLEQFFSPGIAAPKLQRAIIESQCWKGPQGSFLALARVIKLNR